MIDEPVPYERFGGELPLGCDPVSAASSLPPHVYAFSHGRAALSWFVAARGPFAAAAICAYTCPTVPAHLERLGLALGMFDYEADDIADVVAAVPGRCLVLVPAPFGFAPWVEVHSLSRRLGERAAIMIDAAQSAFGALDFPAPAGGAVLSCPRKAVALGDGALLAVHEPNESERKMVAALPAADVASAARQAARSLFALRDPEREPEALALISKSETELPPSPHRMSDAARQALGKIDAAAHRHRRRANAERLVNRLGGKVALASRGEIAPAPSVPFHVPILVEDRAHLLAELRARRVFATALWPDAVHDPARHPRAADLAGRLVALPCDQRYSLSDMDRLADLVTACL